MTKTKKFLMVLKVSVNLTSISSTSQIVYGETKLSLIVQNLYAIAYQGNPRYSISDYLDFIFLNLQRLLFKFYTQPQRCVSFWHLIFLLSAFKKQKMAPVFIQPDANTYPCATSYPGSYPRFFRKNLLSCGYHKQSLKNSLIIPEDETNEIHV